MSDEATILVVDDEDDVRAMIALTLSLRGYDAICAATGEEALALATARRFDLALCDIRMPGIDGAETTRRLKAIAPALPIVIVTGFLSDEALAPCLAAGASGHLRKPFELEELYRAVGAALETGFGEDDG